MRKLKYIYRKYKYMIKVTRQKFIQNIGFSHIKHFSQLIKNTQLLKLVGKVTRALIHDCRHFNDFIFTSDILTHHFDLVFGEFFVKVLILFQVEKSPNADLSSVECRRVTCLRQHSNVGPKVRASYFISSARSRGPLSFPIGRHQR